MKSRCQYDFMHYDDAPEPTDLRNYDDATVTLWASKATGEKLAYLNEVLRLRKLTAKLVKRAYSAGSESTTVRSVKGVRGE